MADKTGHHQRSFIRSNDHSKMRKSRLERFVLETDLNSSHLQVKAALATLDESGLAETVEELKTKLEAMRQLLESDTLDEEKIKIKRKDSGPSIITGNFLSIVFIIVLVTIVLVSGYAFTNLAVAVRKKYPGHHSEL